MREIRLCGHTMGTPHLTPLEAVDFFRRVGYEAVEFLCDPYYLCSITHQASPEARKELKSRADAAGVAIGCLTPYTKDLALPDSRLRVAAIETLRRYVQLAIDLDCRLVRILAGHEVPAADRPSYLANLVESLRQVAEVAGPAHVSLVVENHMDTMAITARETVEVVRAVDHPALGIIYDPGNLFSVGAETPREAVTLQAPYIWHVHAKDHVRRNGKVSSCIIGEGEILWREILSLLGEARYNQYFSVEYEMRWQPGKLPPPERGFVQGASALQTIAAEVERHE